MTAIRVVHFYISAHKLFQSRFGPIYKMMYNTCLDKKIDVSRHSPMVTQGVSRISFRQFKEPQFEKALWNQVSKFKIIVVIGFIFCLFS